MRDSLDAKKIKEIIARYKAEETTQSKIMLGRLQQSKQHYHSCSSYIGSEQYRSLDQEEKTQERTTTSYPIHMETVPYKQYKAPCDNNAH